MDPHTIFIYIYLGGPSTFWEGMWIPIGNCGCFARAYLPTSGSWAATNQTVWSFGLRFRCWRSRTGHSEIKYLLRRIQGPVVDPSTLYCCWRYDNNRFGGFVKYSQTLWIQSYRTSASVRLDPPGTYIAVSNTPPAEKGLGSLGKMKSRSCYASNELWRLLSTSSNQFGWFLDGTHFARGVYKPPEVGGAGRNHHTLGISHY